MITTNRNIFIGAHLTQEQKDIFRKEAERRNCSMSALVSQIVQRWLVVAVTEPVEVRSNKRRDTPEVEAALAKEIEIPLPFGEV